MKRITTRDQRVELGQLLATPAAVAAVPHDELLHALNRHARGDWGEVASDDRTANDLAAEEGLRVWSTYRTLAGVSFWIITEADRSFTTVLLPQDY